MMNPEDGGGVWGFEEDEWDRYAFDKDKVEKQRFIGGNTQLHRKDGCMLRYDRRERINSYCKESSVGGEIGCQ